MKLKKKKPKITHKKSFDRSVSLLITIPKLRNQSLTKEKKNNAKQEIFV